MWDKFGYENNYQNGVMLDDYSGAGLFTFNAAEYERTPLQAIEKFKKELQVAPDWIESSNPQGRMDIG